MKVINILNMGRDYLKKFNKVTPELDAKILLGHSIGLRRQIFAHENIHIDEIDARKFYKLIKIRASGKPVSRIIGKRSFWEDDFEINEYTLDPRPDSEILIEIVLEYFQNRRKNLKFLDLGCGSGCLGLSLLKEFPSSILLAVDNSEHALQKANENAKKLNLDNRFISFNGDWFKTNWAKSIIDKIKFSNNKFKNYFDVIICNPPYIKTKEIQNLEKEVKLFDPNLALDGGLDGCNSYRAIFSKVKLLMSKESIIVLEIGNGLVNDIKKIVENQNLVIKKKYKDLSGNDRAFLIK